MSKFYKALARGFGGVLVALLVLGNMAIVSATPPAPTPEDPTTCPECTGIQGDLDQAYADLEALVLDISAYATEIESLLDQTTATVYEGDSAMMVDLLVSEVQAGHLLTQADCEDGTNSFAYYSQFMYEGALYCLEGEDMWYGVEPDYFNFFTHMYDMTDPWDTDLALGWQLVWDEMIELLTDHDDGGEINLEDMLQLIAGYILSIEDCEDINCPVPTEPECPDCEAIAASLDAELDNFDTLWDEVSAIEADLDSIESDLDDVENQLEQWDQLKADFEAMVEDAGGMHGEDCDNFEVQSGQAWGIAHNFGNIQWCFTNEGQIEEMIQNLDEYWATHSSSHLPSEATLNQQWDDLMNEWIDTLVEYDTALADLAESFATIVDLSADLDDCLAELQALQDDGYCLDQDIAAMQLILDEADTLTGFAGGDAGGDAEEPAGEEGEEGGEEETGDGPGDIADHWAEAIIQALYDAGVVSGDEDTGDFRPNDAVNRAEAAKMFLLGNGDDPAETFVESFFDVLEEHWFWSYVNAAADLEYFNGYEDGSFGPGNPILRAEAATVMLRVLGFTIPEYTTYSFPDITGDEWYADTAERAYQCGLMSGRDVNGETQFAGGSQITRAELAKLVNSVYEGVLEEDCTEV